MPTQQEIINGLKKEGYNDQEIAEAMQELEMEQKQGVMRGSYNDAMDDRGEYDPRVNSSPSMFGGGVDPNLVKWQLEVDDILERAEHILRGDKIKFDKGHTIWIRPNKENEQVLNNYGVNTVMRTLSSYLNRNTILSNYDEKTIKWKVYDFGCELNDLFYTEYDKFNFKATDKRKEIPMLVRILIDMVHSTYLRALGGLEREGLREFRQVTQSEQLGGGININTGQGMKERSVLNPARYLMGKFK